MHVFTIKNVRKNILILLSMLAFCSLHAMADESFEESPLISAARKGDIVEVKRLVIEEGFSVDDNRHFDNCTPLHIAAAYGYLDVIEFLLDNGACIEARNKLRKTPLMRAVSYGRTLAVDLLLRRGADINAQSGEGATPCIIAIYKQQHAVLNILLNNNADLTILAEGIDNYNALMFACSRGEFEMVEMLLDKNVALEQLDNEGKTAFDRALMNNCFDIAALLRKKGAKLYIEGKEYTGYFNESEKKTLLMALVQANVRLGLFKFYVEQKIDNIDAKDKHGDTALIRAIKEKKYEHARVLLEHGANIALKNNGVYSALNYATSQGDCKVNGQPHNGDMYGAHLLIKMYDMDMIRKAPSSLVCSELCSYEMLRFVKIIRSPGFLTESEKGMKYLFWIHFAAIAFEAKAWNDTLKNILIPILCSYKPEVFQMIVTEDSLRWLCNATKNNEVGTLFVPFLPKDTFLMMQRYVAQHYEKKQDPLILPLKTFLNNDYRREKTFALLPFLKDTHFKFMRM